MKNILGKISVLMGFSIIISSFYFWSYIHSVPSKFSLGILIGFIMLLVGILYDWKVRITEKIDFMHGRLDTLYDLYLGDKK